MWSTAAVRLDGPSEWTRMAHGLTWSSCARARESSRSPWSVASSPRLRVEAPPHFGEKGGLFSLHLSLCAQLLRVIALEFPY